MKSNKSKYEHDAMDIVEDTKVPLQTKLLANLMQDRSAAL